MSNTTPQLRDWKARTANTALMSLYILLFFVSMLLCILIDTQSQPLEEFRGDSDPVEGKRLTTANAVLDGVTILYLIGFLVANRPQSSYCSAVYAQVFALLVIFAWNIGISIPMYTLEKKNRTGWWFTIGVVDWVKAGTAIVLILFIGIYTSVHHGVSGWKARFAPLAHKEKVVTSTNSDRGAQIAHIVLLSFLLPLVTAAFACGVVECMPDIFEQYNSNPSPALIIEIVVLIGWAFYIVWYLFARVFSAKSRAVSVTNDLVTMSVFTFLVVVLASVGLALVTTQKRWATGYMGTIAGLVSAAWSAVIIIFVAVYTARHNEDGGAWRRRFASTPLEDDVELDSRNSRKSKEEDAPSGLPYVDSRNDNTV